MDLSELCGNWCCVVLLCSHFKLVTLTKTKSTWVYEDSYENETKELEKDNINLQMNAKQVNEGKIKCEREKRMNETQTKIIK